MLGMELSNTTAVITGASGKLGRAIALSLAGAGCDCVCHYHRNLTVAEELATEIRAGGKNAMAVSADLTEPGQIPKLFDVSTEFAPIRVLINSAAIFPRQSLSEITADSARAVIDANLIGPVLVSKEFVELLKKRLLTPLISGGAIVNIADVGGSKPWADYTMYCASKGGLISATKALAKELAPEITVNAVSPGVISWPDDADEQELKRQLKMIPMQRRGTPEEIAAAVLFLLGNDYITGQVLNVDGGRAI